MGCFTASRCVPVTFALALAFCHQELPRTQLHEYDSIKQNSVYAVISFKWNTLTISWTVKNRVALSLTCFIVKREIDDLNVCVNAWLSSAGPLSLVPYKRTSRFSGYSTICEMTPIRPVIFCVREYWTNIIGSHIVWLHSIIWLILWLLCNGSHS